MTEEEFRRLITTTSNSRLVVYGFDGPTRALLYATAAGTGLRAGELASLTPISFSLSERPTVRCKAAYTKNGQDALLPLHPSLVPPLQAFLSGRQEDRPVWEGSWVKHAARTIRKDEEAAGVVYKTSGGYADFHSLRHLFITSLFRVGVHPRTAQVLARHSTIQLTMAVYTKPGDEATEAVGRLPLVFPLVFPLVLLPPAADQE
jgi:integrase